MDSDVDKAPLVDEAPLAGEVDEAPLAGEVDEAPLPAKGLMFNFATLAVVFDESWEAIANLSECNMDLINKFNFRKLNLYMYLLVNKK